MSHPELAAEQAYIDGAYARLEQLHDQARGRLDDALAMPVSVIAAADAGNLYHEGHREHHQKQSAVMQASNRVDVLTIGDYPLCFGRIDPADEHTLYLGRVAVLDEQQQPIVVDWRAPAAEAFYRATSSDPHGLRRRRHLSCDGRTLIGIEDEYFSEASHDGPSGPGALLNALGKRRTGKMRDIVATVQREQDEIIRASIDGPLVVTGGPGTGKTAVALHRAAYLLFTHRARLGHRGICVVGPNPVFLGYIDQVLPALGESMAELATVSGLIGLAPVRGVDTPEVAAIKGTLDMVDAVARAVRDRERPPSRDQVVEYDDLGAGELRIVVTSDELTDITAKALAGRGTHNDRRLVVESLVIELLVRKYLAMAGEGWPDDGLIAERMRLAPAVERLLHRMWPVLSPQDLLHDLYGSQALLAAAGIPAALYRPWSTPDEAYWTDGDLPLLEEALLLLGPSHGRVRTEDDEIEDDEIHLFGHIVIDEAQDLTPMQWRAIERRSLHRSMTIVGDPAQETAPGAAGLSIPGARQAELTVNYRTPAEIMDVAATVLARIDPDARPPRSVRRGSATPALIACDDVVAEAVARLDGDGMTAIVCAETHREAVIAAAGPDVASASHGTLHGSRVIVPVGLVKGLEFDNVIVVDPAAIVAERGLRALYVALTRATQQVTILQDYAKPSLFTAQSTAFSDAARID